MKLVVDVQGFMTSEKIFTPKELAVYNGTSTSHYLFKAPFSIDSLPKNLQQQASWLMQNHHCIDWDEGFTPVFLFPRILRRLIRGAEFIYVKGREKAMFLRRYTKIPIIEIEGHPALTPTQPACMSHLKSLCYCALSNVYHIYNHYVME